MPKDGDIDFFIITKPSRLWISRTLLVLFKKIFLFNSHKFFCVNYFIDHDHLEIEEKNRFTATEVATLMPVVGRKLYSDFMDENQWVHSFYPNYPRADLGKVRRTSVGGGKWLIERMLKNKLGDNLDTYCMKRTLKRWNKKFPDMPRKTSNWP